MPTRRCTTQPSVATARSYAALTSAATCAASRLPTPAATSLATRAPCVSRRLPSLLKACDLLLLVEPAILHAVNMGGNTALHLAASSCKHDVVRLLLDAGAWVNARGREHFTPLHYACRDGVAHEDAPQVVQLLLERGASPDMMTRDLRTARDLAASDAIRVVLPAGAHAEMQRTYNERLLRAIDDAGGAGGDRLDADAQQARLARILEELPPHVTCPIMHLPMLDPVDTADGFTFERAAITHWLEAHELSPLTGAVLKNKLLAENAAVREATGVELRRAALRARSGTERENGETEL